MSFLYIIVSSHLPIATGTTLFRKYAFYFTTMSMTTFSKTFTDNNNVATDFGHYERIDFRTQVFFTRITV